MEHNDEPMENPQEVIEECLSKFCTPDYIMEPGIFTQLKRYVLILKSCRTSFAASSSSSSFYFFVTVHLLKSIFSFFT